MQPYQITHREWQAGVYFQKELTADEKSRLVNIQKMATQSPDKKFNIYRAELDGETVLAIVPTGEEPFDDESQKNLDWQKVISTGRKSISEREHRQYVQKALLLGKDIPPDVLAEYPELMPLQEVC